MTTHTSLHSVLYRGCLLERPASPHRVFCRRLPARQRFRQLPIQPPLQMFEYNAPVSYISLTAQVVTKVLPYIGELKAHGLGSWTTPVGVIENLTEYAAVTCNSSWILGIAAVTFGFRVLLLPIVFKGMRNNYTMANLRPEIQLHQERAKQLDAQGDEQGAMAAKMKVVEIFQKNGVNPFKAMLPAFVQMPLFISFFFGLKNMAAAPVCMYVQQPIAAQPTMVCLMACLMA